MGDVRRGAGTDGDRSRPTRIARRCLSPRRQQQDAWIPGMQCGCAPAEQHCGRQERQRRRWPQGGDRPRSRREYGQRLLRVPIRLSRDGRGLGRHGSGYRTGTHSNAPTRALGRSWSCAPRLCGRVVARRSISAACPTPWSSPSAHRDAMPGRNRGDLGRRPAKKGNDRTAAGVPTAARRSGVLQLRSQRVRPAPAHSLEHARGLVVGPGHHRLGAGQGQEHQLQRHQAALGPLHG